MGSRGEGVQDKRYTGQKKSKVSHFWPNNYCTLSFLFGRLIFIFDKSKISNTCWRRNVEQTTRQEGKNAQSDSEFIEQVIMHDGDCVATICYCNCNFWSNFCNQSVSFLGR